MFEANKKQMNNTYPQHKKMNDEVQSQNFPKKRDTINRTRI